MSDDSISRFYLAKNYFTSTRYVLFSSVSFFGSMSTSEFLLRQVSRLAKIAPPSTKKYLQELEKEGVIAKVTKGLYPSYKAVRESSLFKNLKKWSLAMELTTKGVVDAIVTECSPDAIILFGSASRGEDVESSDIDIAIIAEETTLDLRKYEKLVGRKLSLLFISKLSDLSSELKNNVLNGMILQGYVKVF